MCARWIFPHHLAEAGFVLGPEGVEGSVLGAVLYAQGHVLVWRKLIGTCVMILQKKYISSRVNASVKLPMLYLWND